MQNILFIYLFKAVKLLNYLNVFFKFVNNFVKYFLFYKFRFSNWMLEYLIKKKLFVLLLNVLNMQYLLFC